VYFVPLSSGVSLAPPNSVLLFQKITCCSFLYSVVSSRKRGVGGDQLGQGCDSPKEPAKMVIPIGRRTS
jgi:hypothetical protein